MVNARKKKFSLDQVLVNREQQMSLLEVVLTATNLSVQSRKAVDTGFCPA